MANSDIRLHTLWSTSFMSRLSHGLVLMLCLMCVLPSQGKVTDLTCEGLTGPLGIDTTVPHFGWKHALSHNGERQTAYEIQVASDSLALTRGHADLWTSGRVKSDSQVMIPYQGKALAERQLCYWRVRTWDEQGKRSPWSGIERFAVGILGGMSSCRPFLAFTGRSGSAISARASSTTSAFPEAMTSSRNSGSFR